MGGVGVLIDYGLMAQRCFDNSKAHGFWDEPRDFEEMMALADSELVEAMEEHRHGKPLEYFPQHSMGCATYAALQGKEIHIRDGEQWWSDGHQLHLIDWDKMPACDCNPKPEGVASELADFVIRVYETCFGRGYRAFNEQMALGTELRLSNNFAANTFRIGKHLHDAAGSLKIRDGGGDGRRSANEWLLFAVRKVFILADSIGCPHDDFIAVIERKMAYNATRPHKHGKRY